MRTLHLGLRVADPERSIAFYSSIGYEVLGDLPATELGTLTMLKLPGDEFVALELVHNPADGWVEPSGLSHFVIQVEDMHATMAHLAARGVQADEPGSPDGSADFWTAWVTDPDGYRIDSHRVTEISSVSTVASSRIWVGTDTELKPGQRMIVEAHKMH